MAQYDALFQIRSSHGNCEACPTDAGEWLLNSAPGNIVPDYSATPG